MPRIRFLEKEAKGFLILATRGSGYGYKDGTLVVSQGLLDAVQTLFTQAGVRYEVVNAGVENRCHEHVQGEEILRDVPGST
jgi:hypothetical protein